MNIECRHECFSHKLFSVRFQLLRHATRLHWRESIKPRLKHCFGIELSSNCGYNEVPWLKILNFVIYFTLSHNNMQMKKVLIVSGLNKQWPPNTQFFLDNTILLVYFSVVNVFSFSSFLHKEWNAASSNHKSNMGLIINIVFYISMQ